MPKTSFLDFEQPIAELETKIEELRFVQDDSALDISEEIKRLSKKSQKLTEDIYGKLSSWQISQVARHPYLVPAMAGLGTKGQRGKGAEGQRGEGQSVGPPFVAMPLCPSTPCCTQ